MMLVYLTFCRFLVELEGLSLTNQDTVIFPLVEIAMLEYIF